MPEVAEAGVGTTDCFSEDLQLLVMPMVLGRERLCKKSKSSHKP